jgi:predicted hydrocarbon binding protein
MSERTNRRLSNRYWRYFLQAAKTEIGAYGLQMMLRQTQLERYIETLPPPDDQGAVLASDYAGLQHAIREYYGRGAYGTLNRIGRGMWGRLLGEAGFGRKLGWALARLLPKRLRCRGMVAYLDQQLNGGTSQFVVRELGPALIVRDQASDLTFGQIADEPICWFTLGLLQAALAWSAGEELDIEEIACGAVGAEACEFRIRLKGA